MANWKDAKIDGIEIGDPTIMIPEKIALKIELESLRYKCNKLCEFTNWLTTPRIAFQDYDKPLMSSNEVLAKIQVKAIKLLQELGEL